MTEDYIPIRIDIVERLSRRDVHDLEQLLRSRVERLQRMEREKIFSQVIEREKQLVAEATAALIIVKGKQ